MLTALRSVDVQDQAQGNLCVRLSYLGYQPQQKSIPVSNLYLHFHAEFNDASQISGYIDIGTWLTQTLPTVEGIDWLSVDEQVLPSLIASYPLHLELINQHTEIKHCHVTEMVKDTAALADLPCLRIRTGVVIVQSLTRCTQHYVEDFACEAMNPELRHLLLIPLTYLVGNSFLPLQFLGTLKVGDVLLLDQVAGRINSNNKTLFKFELEQESLMILEHNEELLAGQATTSAGFVDVKNGFNNLPIELSIVLMERTVTLAELKAITPGEIMSLPSDVIMDVEIRANQCRFARGELVQLTNGQLAVEIRQIGC